MVPATLELPHPERLRLPDVRRPERMPSLPGWVGSRIASLSDEAQPDQTGKWRQVPTIPIRLILKAAEREAIEDHVAALDRLCDETPENSAAAEAAMLVVVTEMMLVLPTTTQNEVSAEVRGEAFLDALDDLTVWAVKAAIRKWNRSDCGRDNQGRLYDYHWCPAPAELRRVAFAQMWHVMSRSRDLRRLLTAEPRIEYSDEHCRAMLERLAGLLPRFRTSSVGRNGSDEVTGEGAGQGANCGTRPRHDPA
jgi:hypothetical protein